MTKSCAGGDEESFRVCDELQRFALGFPLRGVVRGQVVNLLHVKHGVGLHERNVLLDLFALVGGFGRQSAARRSISLSDSVGSVRPTLLAQALPRGDIANASAE